MQPKSMPERGDHSPTAAEQEPTDHPKLTRKNNEHLFADGLKVISYAKLREANLNDVDLSQIDFRDIAISGANLRGADLRGVSMTDEQRAYAKKHGAIVDDDETK